MSTMTAAKAIKQVQSQAEKIKSDETQRFPEAATIGDSWRQGDVYIVVLDKVPADCQKVPIAVQLAEGDTQGSRHCLDSAEGVTMYRRKSPTAFNGPVLLLTTERTINHPEHGNVVLPVGCYEILYQRTLDAEEREQRVAD